MLQLWEPVDVVFDACWFVSLTATASGSCISTNSSVAVTASATPSSNKNYGFLQMKCLEVLKKAGTPLHVQEMQV